jgi:hypothetical protein
MLDSVVDECESIYLWEFVERQHVVYFSITQTVRCGNSAIITEQVVFFVRADQSSVSILLSGIVMETRTTRAWMSRFLVPTGTEWLHG